MGWGQLFRARHDASNEVVAGRDLSIFMGMERDEAREHLIALRNEEHSARALCQVERADKLRCYGDRVERRLRLIATPDYPVVPA